MLYNIGHQCDHVDSIPILKPKNDDNKPMERPKEGPEDVGEQGDYVGRRADFADRQIHLCCNHTKSRNERSSCPSLFQNQLQCIEDIYIWIIGEYVGR